MPERGGPLQDWWTSARRRRWRRSPAPRGTAAAFEANYRTYPQLYEATRPLL